MYHLENAVVCKMHRHRQQSLVYNDLQEAYNQNKPMRPELVSPPNSDARNDQIWCLKPDSVQWNNYQCHQIYEASLFAEACVGTVYLNALREAYYEMERAQPLFRKIFRENGYTGPDPSEDDFAQQESQLFDNIKEKYSLVWFAKHGYCIVPTCRYPFTQRISFYQESLKMWKNYSVEGNKLYNNPYTGYDAAVNLYINAHSPLNKRSVSMRSSTRVDNELKRPMQKFRGDKRGTDQYTFYPDKFHKIS